MHLIFDKGQFDIFNPILVLDGLGNKTELLTLIGKKVSSSYSNKKEIRITFETDEYLSISVLDRDYTGPEAACFYPKKGNIIVFE